MTVRAAIAPVSQVGTIEVNVKRSVDSKIRRPSAIAGTKL